MSHYDAETLALLALGETGVTPDDSAHLSDCAHCRTEVDQLAAVVAGARRIDVRDLPTAPPAAVWDRIVAEIESDTASAGEHEPATATGDVDEVVVPISSRRTSRRSRSLVSVAAAAAVGLIVGIGGTWALTRPDTATSPPIAQGQVSVAALKPLDTPQASGTAVLRVVSAQQRSMTVTVANLPTQPATFYEVWLMDPTDSHLVSLGVLGADGKGAYVVPPGLDLAQYTAVDVSLQPMNGSPEHSKTSAVRGLLKT